MAADALLASRIVWFDAYVTNVDRSARNTNMMMWHRRLWLIDHGAALYFHHAWDDDPARARAAFTPIKNHVLLPLACELAAIDASMAALVTPTLVHDLVACIPESWLCNEPAMADIAAHRQAYVDYLLRRIEAPRAFVEEAIRAHASHV